MELEVEQQEGANQAAIDMVQAMLTRFLEIGQDRIVRVTIFGRSEAEEELLTVGMLRPPEFCVSSDVTTRGYPCWWYIKEDGEWDWI